MDNISAVEVVEAFDHLYGEEQFVFSGQCLQLVSVESVVGQ